MKNHRITQPLKVAVFPFIRSYAKLQTNEQIWHENNSIEFEVTEIVEYRDKVVIVDSHSNSYDIIGKNSKKTYPKDVIKADCIQKNIVSNLLEGTISFRWNTFKSVSTSKALTDVKDAEAVINSLENNVQIRPQELKTDGSIKKSGLRAPQVGAIYSILSHSAISNEAVSIVLPTGTGKSETILGTIVAKRLLRSLIIVPSDGLRNQFFENCKGWGILRTVNVVEEAALNPIVAKLTSSMKDDSEIERLIMGSNIIIATASILNKLKQRTLSVLNNNIDALFIDEAHHSAAPTWDRLKGVLSNPIVIQFTATPFREDGKPIGGKIIFNYSLEEAQKNNFFTKIDFVPVVDYDPENWDKTISEKAIEILKKDITEGHNHILMARVDNIDEAKRIYATYYQQHTEFNPILITSKSGSANSLIDQLRTGHSKIVVCVNMLGEGIDIPQLKIAALHDIRKSLTVTLQFIGRFTRSNKSISSAKIIANIADVKIEKRLKQLYKEDADWGKLIAFSSAKEIQKKIKFQEVLVNFKNSKIPLFNIKPKLSAVAYHAKNDKWKPDVIEKYLAEEEDLYLCDVNEQDGLAIAIKQVESEIDWLDSKIFVESTWELLLFYFDKKNQILYVNSSQKNVDPVLVNQVIDVDFIYDREFPFKCYHGLGYVVLFTLGLDRNTDSPIKYAMYAGSNIYDGITDMEKNKSSKSNTYGYGFKDGEELTLGASKHGKIWSRLIGNVQDWKEWCDGIGEKLLDTTIDVNEIFKGFLQPMRFNETGFLTLSNPTSIDFPSSFYQENESIQLFIIDGNEFELSEITLDIAKIANGYNINLNHEHGKYTLSLTYTDEIFNFSPVNFSNILFKKRKKEVDFIEYLKTEDSFKIRLLDGTFLENNYHFKPHTPEAIFPLDINRITTVDWSGVDISKESRGLVAPYVIDSIQNKIFKLKDNTGRFTIIVNDDGAGEIGDLLCFGVENDYLIIEIIHCKYHIRSNPLGSRVDDFYVLCGQAQKTVKSVPDLLRLFDHIRTRDIKTQKLGGSRFLKGDLKTLELLIKSNSFKRPKIKVILVQPGLLKTAINANVLELLGATFTLLKETLNADFEVLSS